MRAAKFTEKGKTVKRAKISVLLHPSLHKALMAEVAHLHTNTSGYVGSLIAQRLNWKAV